ncbi:MULTISPECIES: UbiH/UbiF family hydroxylase [unclassified Mesorhizobium]|uniref:UbiH/UbiF family hydroxylase n=2 Tax=Mesorhizobium TaxID=68287 RepID=UPI000FCB7D17|nr:MULTISPECIES: UbiH/UbiF family hydroxylase [unclassified Mesorhizobium]RUX77170.1 UbiH/UbiF family hydroxylase [Mesorhizobium sp. M7A.F.Ca.US.005.03.1.1]RUY18337.1 UbiH/UbiF family hydroxylase [Mesorhizobium sp. M7A.F.Ca.US.005.03.2.1]RUY26778.1 UbiH/UbiF family hydroxylase [Mesorhizobium sp. M7A.F.Ca.US.001.04.2.1]RUY39245.1 UbiH/UbiF family hydroxylase [Mesorhizobium sp. M7A.F.Ca.US.001.04.1.1]RVA05255.1 UbiH/UbiF family hydroxylase [Mesorhizobium sp. M7A.F.Ca.US.001.02.1.1]
MEHQQTARILVAGTGPAGLIAALGFAAEGFPVTLVGPEATAPDGRTTALMNPALKVLDRLGVLEAVISKAAPLKVMRIVDATSRLIRSPVVTFRASEIDEDEFGLNLPNSVLTPALAGAVAAHPGIDWLRSMVANWHLDAEHVRAGLADGSTVDAALAVAADGRLSPARQAAGISTSARSYPQAALVLNFGHSGDHAFTSTEFHTETGPFTQVPLPGNRSSLVWVVKPETATELAALDDATLSQRVEQQMQSMLGRVAVEPGRQIYPLSAVTPLRFARDRVALVGEAAHVFPPIGAQGLNLGIRDVDDLIGIACENLSDPGAAKALAAYDFKRRPDILARSSAVNLLNMSLLSDMLPAQMARVAGLGVLGGFAPLRAFFMREGLRPGSGFAALAGGLGKQVRR